MWFKKRYELNQSTEFVAGEQCSNIKTKRNTYIEYMSKNLYERILFDVYAHIAEKKKFEPIAYDRFTPKQDGLITIIAEAMAEQSKVFVKFEKKSGVSLISKYKNNPTGGVSDVVEIDFSDFEQGALVNDAFSLDYDNILSTESAIVSNRSVIAKIANMDTIMVASNDQRKKNIFLSMINEMYSALKSGGIGVISSESSIEKVKLDTKPNSEARAGLYERLSSITGYPSIFFDGKQQATLGGSGDSQREATELAREYYFHSVISPIFSAITGKPVTLLPPIKSLDEIKSISDLIEMSGSFSEKGKEKIAGIAGFTKEDLNDG